MMIRTCKSLVHICEHIFISFLFSVKSNLPFRYYGSHFFNFQSTKARRSRSDDVDAVRRLPLLNDTFYRDILCEIGGMFAIANSVDNIHKRPWIGYQSWRASGRKVRLMLIDSHEL